MKSFLQGLSLYPLWRWLHQATCLHKTIYTLWDFEGEVCNDCGKYWDKVEL